MVRASRSPPLDSLKLSRSHGGCRRESARNQWLTADRAERRRQIVSVLALAVVLGAGALLISLGLAH